MDLIPWPAVANKVAEGTVLSGGTVLVPQGITMVVVVMVMVVVVVVVMVVVAIVPVIVVVVVGILIVETSANMCKQ